jgi:4'-phosphopantetheinyl transferase
LRSIAPHYKLNNQTRQDAISGKVTLSVVLDRRTEACRILTNQCAPKFVRGREATSFLQRATSMFEIGVDQVHLWVAFVNQIAKEKFFFGYRDLLNSAERQQEDRFCFDADKRRYLVTRALVRTVLSRYISVRAEELTFATGPNGQPKLSSYGSLAQHIRFNISHTSELVILGVSNRCAIGVDVENCHSCRPVKAMASRFFARDEIVELSALPLSGQLMRFYECWTLKESYIKARGKGLSIATSQFSFLFPGNNTIRMSMDMGLADQPSRWRFWQLRASADHLVAICAEQGTRTVPSLVVRKIVPLGIEEPLSCMDLKISE